MTTVIPGLLAEPVTFGDRMVRLVLKYEGNGLKHYPEPYDAEDPEDAPVLVLRAERKFGVGFETCKEGAFVTKIDARTPTKELYELLEQVWQRIHYAAYQNKLGGLLREHAAYVSPKWLEPWRYSAYELYPGAPVGKDLEPEWYYEKSYLGTMD